MDDPIAHFTKTSQSEGLETLFYVPAIAKGDTALTLHVSTWNQSNARLELEELRNAIDRLLRDWNLGTYAKYPPATADDSKPRPSLYRIAQEFPPMLKAMMGKL
ncbi:hypothetical protein HQ945_21755 [Phyllobacterium sp. BT25]|uniref:Uncharacterized protein n=1 Tax=Phyllobacterium pellucidum TaxID=2740464 RepID=A0A849VZ71_9HYPH|nr:hypothetical protein [Phyllobacterium pellucidum]NTS33889.1 hypothetical protein [Phyllobacterium pellucidum]